MLDFHEGLGGCLAGCQAGWSIGWLAGWLGRYQEASKMKPLSSKFGAKCDPFVRNRRHNACLLALQQSFGNISGAENRTPYHEIAPKMRPLRHKFDVEMAKMTILHKKNTDKNATPWPKIGPKAFRN